MNRSIKTSYQAAASPSRTDEKPERASTALVLPTLNAGPDFIFWLAALREQTMQPDKLLLVDSSSTDDTAKLAAEFGFEVKTIERDDFSHGGTRQMCVDLLSDYELILFLTQDALLAAPDALEKLLGWFKDARVGAAYGRQLPRPGAGPIEAHARLFNYPEENRVKSASDIPTLGLKTSFISNSFAAYRRTALMEVDGFPTHTIQNEDTHAASRMILRGWKIVYAAEAAVHHSHPFSWWQELRRYFDIGVFHARDPWIRESFGQAEGEGRRFVRSEIDYLKRQRPLAIPSAMVRTGLKLLGYKLGNHERWLPSLIKRVLSANRPYWRQQHEADEVRS